MKAKRDFGWALKTLRKGTGVRRAGWDGMWLAIQLPVLRSDAPYIYTKTAQGRYVPWNPSQEDMLAWDWTFAE